MIVDKLSKVNEPIRILRNINEKYISNSIIAGGYYRDMYHKLEYNDIDIFVCTSFAKSDHIASDALTTDFWTEVFDLNLDRTWEPDYIEELEADGDYDNLNDIEMVFELSKNDIKYNVVLVDIEPVDYVNEVFDFGICKAYCDGTKVTFTKDFISDAENKFLTFTNLTASVDSFCYSMNTHLQKLIMKFPNHRIYVPQKYMTHIHLLPNDLGAKIKAC